MIPKGASIKKNLRAFQRKKESFDLHIISSRRVKVFTLSPKSPTSSLNTILGVNRAETSDGCLEHIIAYVKSS